ILPSCVYADVEGDHRSVFTGRCGASARRSGSWRLACSESVSSSSLQGFLPNQPIGVLLSDLNGLSAPFVHHQGPDAATAGVGECSTPSTVSTTRYVPTATGRPRGGPAPGRGRPPPARGGSPVRSHTSLCNPGSVSALISRTVLPSMSITLMPAAFAFSVSE